jgi:DnaJ-class molecular chaperone
MRDPYQVLGVQKGADAAAIKSAFRKLAKKLHPDANRDNPKAATQFSELNSAYEILGDEAKRKQFDAGEIDAEGKPTARGFEGFGAGGPGGARGGFEGFGGQSGFGGGDTIFETFTYGPEGARRTSNRGRAGGAGGGSFEDILKGMFGGGGPQGGTYSGGQGPRGGFGGFAQEDFGGGAGRDVQAAVTATLAQVASGTKLRVRLPTGKDVEVKIPAGLTDGQTIRLKGQGLPGPGGDGDALITVNILADSRFVRDGNDLRLELPITLYEAVLGAKVRVPTLDGAVTLTVPPNTSSGRVFRLKGKGMPTKTAAGDLFATIRIVLPDSKDTELDALMEKWRDNKPYNPRGET